MIESKLPVLMAQRKIYKIADVWRATKISRTTLTQLYYGKGGGIQFGTLETLCSFLHCEVGDLLKRVPDNESVNA